MARYFTSESVSEGHPDKICDQISDAVLDVVLEQDPFGRVAVETLITHGLCILAGEVTTSAKVPFREIAQQVIRDIGYDDVTKGFDPNHQPILVHIHEQSPDIAMGVRKTLSADQGAGDQGIMFGYACDETEEAMPLSIFLAHRLLQNLAQARKKGGIGWLYPDAKSQVTVEYNEANEITRVDTVVLSTQHAPDVSQSQIQEFVIDEIIKKTIPAHLIDSRTRFLINPTGRFVIGGPASDTGLTGRKIIVDTYGGHGAHGGGAFSGKDPTKVDRTASYVARHVAKNIVKAGLARRCLVQLAYAIGVSEPVAIYIHDYNTAKVPSEALAQAVRELWDLRPGPMIQEFDLLKPIYRATATYGHFGRPEFPWEKTNKVEMLKQYFKI